MFFMVISLVAMFCVQTVAHIVVNLANPLELATVQLGQLTGELTSKMILEINLAALMVCIALSSICFLFSAVFNTSKFSIGCSKIFVGESILANMLAMFGNLGVGGLDNFKYATICSFYDYQSVLFETNDWSYKLIFPAIISIVAFTIGGIVFKKKRSAITKKH